MQVFANGKRRFHSFMEFYVLHRKQSRGKHLITVALKRLRDIADNVFMTGFRSKMAHIWIHFSTSIKLFQLKALV